MLISYTCKGKVGAVLLWRRLGGNTVIIATVLQDNRVLVEEEHPIRFGLLTRKQEVALAVRNCQSITGLRAWNNRGALGRITVRQKDLLGRDGVTPIWSFLAQLRGTTLKVKYSADFRICGAGGIASRIVDGNTILRLRIPVAYANDCKYWACISYEGGMPELQRDPPTQLDGGFLNVTGNHSGGKTGCEYILAWRLST